MEEFKKQTESKQKKMEKMMEKMMDENKILKKQVNINNNKTKNINSHYTQNIQNTQNINNIKLVAFGEEDLTYISEKICKFFLKKGFQSVPQFIEHIHFNKNKPENHNVYIPNMKDLYAMIFDGKRWNLKEKEEIINQLFDDKESFLEEKYQEYFDNLDEITKKKFKRFLEHSNTETKKKLKNEIKLLIYNKRHVAINTKKNMNNEDNELLK